MYATMALVTNLHCFTYQIRVVLARPTQTLQGLVQQYVHDA
jgi:hypothetical protein